MHEQTRSCIDFHNGCALRFHGFGNVLRHQINASNVEAHNACCQSSQFGDIGVHQVCNIHGHVARAHHHDLAVFFGHAVASEALSLEF